jgi:HD-GYP domain-containing protein (c-di-GMP phosphodiesterase class II)
MTLSQALKIMDNFRDNGPIDPDLYALFLSHQVPQRYAQKFLAPAQQDC